MTRRVCTCAQRANRLEPCGRALYSGNVTGEVAINPLGEVDAGDSDETGSITELQISLAVTFDTSVGAWAFEVEITFQKGEPGDLWLDIRAFGSASSSKAGTDRYCSPRH